MYAYTFFSSIPKAASSIGEHFGSGFDFPILNEEFLGAQSNPQPITV